MSTIQISWVSAQAGLRTIAEFLAAGFEIRAYDFDNCGQVAVGVYDPNMPQYGDIGQGIAPTFDEALTLAADEASAALPILAFGADYTVCP